MNGPMRMSPITALFLGLFGIGAVGIASGTAVTLYAMNIIDNSSIQVVNFLDGTVGDLVTNLPKILEALPETIKDVMQAERSPEYASHLDVKMKFIEGKHGVRPSLTIVNNGTEVVSVLAIRVAALNEDDTSIREWNQVVATPFAFGDKDWPGPIYPGETRYFSFSEYNSLNSLGSSEKIVGVTEISEIFVHIPKERT